MTDDEVQKLDELFDKKLSPIHEELKGVNRRLDTVAGHLEKVDERLTSVEKTQTEHSLKLDKIDRMDDHGERVEALEAKTAHLPTPPRSR